MLPVEGGSFLMGDEHGDLWEACRPVHEVTVSDFYIGKFAGSDRLKDVGWFDENSGSETKPIGLKYPNQLGIHDMSGNVWEWCEDDWHENYKGAPENGSAWITRMAPGTYRVFRGGGWYDGALFCRAAIRDRVAPGRRGNYLGFRLVLAPQSVGRPDPAFL
ncbi:MAG: formylglycine-generating enzyme family protein [Lewinellaceae bacterium]|nr:formylglycine-generating enzyme family protein [Lewinellaceae bacterium]